MSSTRLPGKVLAPLAGEPLLLRLVERVKQARLVDLIVVATSTEPTDHTVADLCRAHDIAVMRGPLNDVLRRFIQVCDRFNPSSVVRLTGDNPLVDPELIDMVVKTHLEMGPDYTGNSVHRTFPYGLDVEAIDTRALRAVEHLPLSPAEREHVTLGIRNRPELFRIESVTNSEDLSDLRFTVDYRADLAFAQEVFDHLYPANPEFRLRDVVEFLSRHPELRRTIHDVAT